MKFRNLVCMSALVTCVAFSALAQGLPQASKPEDVGLSSERLKRVTAAFQADVDKGAVKAGPAEEPIATHPVEVEGGDVRLLLPRG